MVVANESLQKNSSVGNEAVNIRMSGRDGISVSLLVQADFLCEASVAALLAIGPRFINRRYVGSSFFGNRKTI